MRNGENEKSLAETTGNGMFRRKCCPLYVAALLYEDCTTLYMADRGRFNIDAAIYSVYNEYLLSRKASME